MHYTLAILLGCSIGLNVVLWRILKLRTHPVRAEFTLAQLVTEGVALAEASHLKGHARFHIAKQYVMERAAKQKLKYDERDLALRIEAQRLAKKA